MVNATIKGTRLEIYFQPSFTINTKDTEIEFQLRNIELEVYDPWSKQLRTVKATKGEREAYLILDKLSVLVPELEIEITEAPELSNSLDQGTEENPVIQ